MMVYYSIRIVLRPVTKSHKTVMDLFIGFFAEKHERTAERLPHASGGIHKLTLLRDSH